MSDNKLIVYSDDFELLLKQEAEKAEAMSILHSKSYQRFNRFSIYINIPVIVLSSIIGFLSPLTLFEGQSILLGSLSIFIAILKTIDNFFDFTKRCETHRMTALNYGKISKMVQIQLSLERPYRILAGDLFDVISNDLQNIRDAEPIVPDIIISAFNHKYKDDKTTKPSITNGLTEVKINRKLPDPELKPPEPTATAPVIELVRNEVVSLPTIVVDEKPPKQEEKPKKPPFR